MGGRKGIHTECNRTWESGELKVAWVWANRERRAESDVHTFCMRIEGNVVNGRWQGNAKERMQHACSGWPMQARKSKFFSPRVMEMGWWLVDWSVLAVLYAASVER